MANFISENSGLGKMQAMQEALANSPKPPKVKIKVKIKTPGGKENVRGDKQDSNRNKQGY